MITWSHDDVLQQVITRDIPESDRGSIPTFNDFPEWMIEEIRPVARESIHGAVHYVRFYLAADVYRSNIGEFVQEVVRDGHPAATWRVGDCLCVPEESQIESLLTTEYVATLEGISGERWFRLIEPGEIDPSGSFDGAVGVVQRKVRYGQSDAHGPDGITIVIIGPATVEPIPPERLAVSIRRWLARRLAWRAQVYLRKAGPMVAAQGIIDRVSRGKPLAVTRDAEIAAAALAREARDHGADADFLQRAGFLGPDSWYEG